MVFLTLTSTARDSGGPGIGESRLCRNIKHDFGAIKTAVMELKPSPRG